jgi:hypothetical protein
MRHANYGGVVEDIWMNTRADADDDRRDFTDPNSPDSSPSWDEIEQANATINPDASDMDRG